MTTKLCVLLSLLTIWVTSCSCDEAPLVTTPLGKIEGSIKKSFDGRKFSAFEGVPFAKPPVGALRFAEPQPIEPWKGTWKATTVYECLQKLFFGLGISGDEDCLYLNVYVPREKPIPQEKLEVIVNIHGGAFMAGSGHAYAHPEYLMDRDFVYVSINYRVGVLGFLSTGDKVLPGNNGLKDQTLALKWVQENIASFGGNPNSVTLIGLSAGGASVHYHYLSPLSKGLFHRGLAQSGAATNCWALQEQPLQKTKQLAVAAGCPVDNSKTLVECLKQRPGKILLEALKSLEGSIGYPLAPLAPVIEKLSPNPFLPDLPYFLLTQRKVYDVPLIMSITADEGLLFALWISKELEKVNSDWSEIAPLLLDYNYTSAKTLWASNAKEIKDFYFGEEKDITIEKLSVLLTDRLFSFDAESAARLQSKATQSPVYFYKINFIGSNSFTNTFAENPKNLKGASHGDDAQFIFPIFENHIPSDADVEMKEAFLDMLVSFAKTDVPKFKGVTWEPTKHDQLTYLDISSPTDMKMVKGKELAPRSFWKQLGLLENQNIVIAKDEL